MSWSKTLLRNGFLAISLAAGTVLAGCTMGPVHSGAIAQSSPALTYAEPNSRLEQVVYQELALRLGASTSPSASLVNVSVATSGATEALSGSPNPNTLRSLTVTAQMTVSPADGSATEPITLTRSATAQYTTNAQALAAQEARNEAEERAARAVAESLRLAYLASLVRN
jgi:LPS-assembly lipoprotein